MEQQPKEIEFNGQKYTRTDSIAQPAPDLDGKPYVVIRTYSDGVHVGYLDSREDHPGGFAVRILQSRRCNRFLGCGGWCGCSELALNGPDPEKASISNPLPHHECVAIGISPVSASAKSRLDKCHE